MKFAPWVLVVVTAACAHHDRIVESTLARSRTAFSLALPVVTRWHGASTSLGIAEMGSFHATSTLDVAVEFGYVPGRDTDEPMTTHDLELAVAGVRWYPFGPPPRSWHDLAPASGLYLRGDTGTMILSRASSHDFAFAAGGGLGYRFPMSGTWGPSIEATDHALVGIPGAPHVFLLSLRLELEH